MLGSRRSTLVRQTNWCSMSAPVMPPRIEGPGFGPPALLVWRVTRLVDHGSMSGKVAVIVPVWLVMVSVMSVNVTLTRVSVMLALGHAKVEGTPTAFVLTLKVPLPCRVSNVTEPVTVVVVVCSPLGSLLPLGVTQPTVTVAVADRLAVALVPAPQTSPVAVKNAVPVGPLVFVAVTSSVVFSQTCSPPVLVTDVGGTANAGTAAMVAIARDNSPTSPTLTPSRFTYSSFRHLSYVPCGSYLPSHVIRHLLSLMYGIEPGACAPLDGSRDHEPCRSDDARGSARPGAVTWSAAVCQG